MPAERLAPVVFSSRRRHTMSLCDWSADVCSSDLAMWVSSLPAAVPVCWSSAVPLLRSRCGALATGVTVTSMVPLVVTVMGEPHRKGTPLTFSHKVSTYPSLSLKRQPSWAGVRVQLPPPLSMPAERLGPVGTPVMVTFFFFNDTATTEIYALSLHDALPILPAAVPVCWSSAVPLLRSRCGALATGVTVTSMVPLVVTVMGE